MNINLMGSVSNTGYGIATKYIMKALADKGHKIALFPKGSASANNEEEVNFLKECVENNKMFDYNAPTLQIWHQFDLAQRVGRGPYFAMPIFELDRFNEVEKHHLGFPDYLIPCSSWAASIIGEQTERTKDCYNVPLGVDSNIFYPGCREDNTKVSKRIKPNGDEYVFFNCGKWEKRKGHDFLADCFSRAFTFKDNVRLVMMPNNPFLTQVQVGAWHSRYLGSPLSSKIDILPPALTHGDVAAIMDSIDCGVFPSRGEGWNMELLEVMACGKPVITTNYSAHTEYCNKENSYLIEPEELEDAYDGIWFHGQGRWMEFDYDQEEQLIEHMRFCYKNKPENPKGVETARDFTWGATAHKLLTLFGE